MNKPIHYVLIGSGSIIIVLLISFFVRQTFQNQAPTVATAGSVAGVDVAVSQVPAELKTTAVTLDTCPPGKHGDLSLNDIANKPEPTVFDEQNTKTGGVLGIVYEADASNESTPPTDFTVAKLPNGFVQGSWTHNGMMFKTFNVYLKGPTGGWTKIGKIDRSQSPQYSFVDQTVRTGGPYSFALTIVGSGGRESDCSAPAEITFE